VFAVEAIGRMNPAAPKGWWLRGYCRGMTPATTLRFFGRYLVVVASGFVLIPERVLPLVGFEPPRDVWVRVLGGILAILAGYYFAAARANDVRFARWTVWGRLPLLPFYGALVAFAGAEWPLIAVGVFESGCGVWTGWALRRERSGG
jgi:hypothetical protein